MGPLIDAEFAQHGHQVISLHAVGFAPFFLDVHDATLDAARQVAANGTINRARNTLRASLKHAVANGDLISAPPSRRWRAPAKERWLLRKEAARLVRAVHPARWYYLRLFILIALYTGAMHRAILQLTWDRVDLDNGRIDFRIPKRQPPRRKRSNERFLHCHVARVSRTVLGGLAAWAVCLLAIVLLAACQPTLAPAPSFTGYRSKGHTEDKMAADAANCRNNTRVVSGANASVYFWDAYTDCMLGKGYTRN